MHDCHASGHDPRVLLRRCAVAAGEEAKGQSGKGIRQKAAGLLADFRVLLAHPVYVFTVVGTTIFTGAAI